MTHDIRDIALAGYFTEREQKEIEFCTVYVSLFNHGTDGHTLRSIIAKQASLITMLERKIKQLTE
jgi:hypothetical protein